MSQADLQARNGAVKENLEALKEDAAKLAGSIGDAAAGAIDHGRHQVEDAAEHAMERAQTVFTAMENQVRTRPAAALGLALGTGLVLGFLMRR